MRTGRSHELERIAAAALGAVPVVALGAADGGFYPRPWGWATVGLGLALVSAAAIRRELHVGKNVLFLVLALSVLTAWAAASLMWTRSVAATALELERLVLYAVAVAAAALIVRRRTSSELVAGVFLGTTTLAIWGLTAYLLTREGPADPLQGWYLHRPIGYANAMAVTAALAILLGLGIATQTRSRKVRALVAVSLVPLAAALALTGSRAAWAALLAGALVLVALTSDRARLVSALPILVVPAFAAVLVGSSGVTDTTLLGREADRLGELLLVVVLTLTAVAAALASRRVGATSGRVPGRAAACAVLVGIAAAAVFVAANPDVLTGDRAIYWHVAATELAERPLLGTGAGGFGQAWLEHRPEPISVRDAHSLPIETATELGVVGLALVFVLFAAPFAWSARARRSPHVPAVAGAFAAFTAHTAVDWDWELPSVALAGLFCAVALGVSASAEQGLGLAPWQRRGAIALGVGAVAVGLVGFVSASAVEDANRALARGDHTAARRAAERAERWHPWALEPTLIRGRSFLALGDRDSARVSFVRAAAREPNDYRVWLALAAVSDGEAVAAALQRASELNRFAVARN